MLHKLHSVSKCSAVYLTHWTCVIFPCGLSKLLPKVYPCSCVQGDDIHFSAVVTTVNQAEGGASWSVPVKWKQTSFESLSSSSSFLGSSVGKESACNARDPGLIPGSGRSTGERIGYSLHSGLENSIDCIVHGVAKSQTRLSDLHFHFHCHFRTWLLNRVVVQVMYMSCEERWRKEEGGDLRRVTAVHQLATRLGPRSFNLWPSGSLPTEKCALVKRKLCASSQL